MIKAIDTSHWQNSKVDYAAAKKAGYDIAIFKVGEKTTKDKCFEKDYKKAVAAGMKVGVYYFANAKTATEAKNEAQQCLLMLAGIKLDFPVAYDMEIAAYKKSANKTLNSEIYNAFAKAIRNKSIYDVMLYTGESMFNSYFNKSLITDKIWIAKYSSKSPSVGRQVYGWQYTSDAIKTDFYKDKLDRSIFYDELSNIGNTNVSIVKKNPYPEPTSTVKRTTPTMSGNNVRWVQYALIECGYKITLDGKFGPASEKAVKSFQTEYKKTHKSFAVDGKVGPATRAALKEVSGLS